MYRITKVALLSVSLLVVSAGAIAGNIPAIGLAYPQINKTLIELLTTLPSLFIILTVLISPKIAKKIGYKKTVQLGIVFVLIAGMLPVVTTSFVLLFMSRVLFGVGVGLFNPLLYSFAAAMYRGKELASVIGLQSAFEGIGGMLVTFLVGQLLLVNWRISFTAYLIACPILFFFPCARGEHCTSFFQIKNSGWKNSAPIRWVFVAAADHGNHLYVRYRKSHGVIDGKRDWSSDCRQ